jgi:tetratricopeptide (TPR) repeat protein
LNRIAGGWLCRYIYVMATISDALASAIQHHQAGRLRAAEQMYRQILEVQPNQADAWHLLGLLAYQLGKYAIAVEYIARAIGLKGNAATFHNNLGNALSCQRKLDEAIASYRKALELKPDYAEAHYRLGNALKDQGKLDEAIACYRRTLELNPDFVEAHSNLGVALKDLGNLNEAVTCYRRALQRNPNLAMVHNNLGVALTNQGKLDEAIACCRRALELEPEFAEAHYNLGNAWKDQGKLDDAVACYRRALELKPALVKAHGNLGIALQEIGDFHGAEDCFRAALRQDSRFAFAHYKLAELLRGKLPENDLVAQRRLLEGSDLTDAQRLFLHVGLAQVLDARGEYAEAAEHLDRGNALQLAEWRKCGQEYDPKEYEFLVARMIAACTSDFFARVRGFGLESELPVFIVGLPRSGTTLMEQILSSHCQVFGAGEVKLAQDTMAALGGEGIDSIEGLRRLDRPTAQRLASRHLERLRALSGAALRIVDKMPENYLYLGLLASLFPRAKFIHCRRDLRDVAVSCWLTHFREIRWANDQGHIASRFHEYRRIMEHWRTVLPVPLLEVDYEETVADLEGAARKLVAWCGLAWEPACLEFHQAKRPVRTVSAVQVRQPVYRTSVGRWKHYEHALASLFARLESAGAHDRAGR